MYFTLVGALANIKQRAHMEIDLHRVNILTAFETLSEQPVTTHDGLTFIRVRKLAKQTHFFTACTTSTAHSNTYWY